MVVALHRYTAERARGNACKHRAREPTNEQSHGPPLATHRCAASLLEAAELATRCPEVGVPCKSEMK